MPWVAALPLTQKFAEGSEFFLLGIEVVEEGDDVAEGSQAGVFVVTEVGDVPEAGDAGLIEVDLSSASCEAMNEVGPEEFFDHFGVEAAELGGFAEVGEEGVECGGFADTGELIMAGHGWFGLELAGASIEGRRFGESFPVEFLFRRDFVRNGDADDGVKVAAGEAAILDAELGAVVGEGGDLNANIAGEGADGHFCSENRFPRGKCEIVVEIGAGNAEVRVFLKTNVEEEVTGFSAIVSGVPEAGAADELAFGDAFWDANF